MKRAEHIPAHEADDDQAWNVIIETPKGSCNKYRYEEQFGVFSLAKALPEGLSFPYDFGFLPSTVGEDGDPLDVLLMMDQPTFPGCLVPARLIGNIEAEQTERDGKSDRNDRLIAVPVQSRRFGNIKSISQVDRQTLDEIGEFFANYNRQSGKKFHVINFSNPQRAIALAKQGIKKFRRKSRKRSKR